MTLPVAAHFVNPKNGNFFWTNGDIDRSAGAGWFGFGWDSEFETRLVAMPEGSVAVQESGTGKMDFKAP